MTVFKKFLDQIEQGLDFFLSEAAIEKCKEEFKDKKEEAGEDVLQEIRVFVTLIGLKGFLIWKRL